MPWDEEEAITFDRITAAVKDVRAAAGAFPELLPKMLRTFAAECSEAGGFDDCPTCSGTGISPDETNHYAEDDCTTCYGEGRISKELVGALWAIHLAVYSADTVPALTKAAIEKWGKSRAAS